jgi:hypothetical protein
MAAAVVLSAYWTCSGLVKASQPRRDVVANIVRGEAEAYWAHFPVSKVSGNAVAGKIMDKVNKRLAEAKTNGLSRIGCLSQNKAN